MNVFGSTSGKTLRGPRGLRGFPDNDALELCNYLPNTISKCLRENDQEASFVLTSTEDCEMADNKVKTWKNKRSDPDNFIHNGNLVAVKPSSLSQIGHDPMYALNFPGQYTTGIFPLNTSNPYGYFCITFCSSSDALQTLIANQAPTDHPKAHQYHEITITNSDISIHGYRDGKIVVEPIMHNTKKWTTLYLEWTAGPHVVDYTYTINNEPHSHGTFHLDQSGMMIYGFTMGSRVDGTQPFSGQLHAIETYPSQHPIPILLRNLVISHQRRWIDL